MSTLTSEVYKELAFRLKNCVSLLTPEMTSEAVEHISHYIDHGELEMAYESLILSCIKEGVDCDNHVLENLHSMGVDLSMETEAVFEANFWQLAQEYFEQHRTAQDTRFS